MNNTIRMKIMQRPHKFLCNLLDCRFGKALVVLKDFEELALAKFGNYTKISIRFKAIKHQNDVFMVELSQNSNLLTQVLDILLGFAMFGNEFDGANETSVLSTCLIHFSKGPFANGVKQDVIVHRDMKIFEN